MSSWWFSRKAPSAETTPAVGYDAFFVADGTGGTTAGSLYRKDSTGAVTLVGAAGSAAVAISSPSAAPTAAVGYSTLFVSDGTGGTIGGSVYQKDASGTVTVVGPSTWILGLVFQAPSTVPTPLSGVAVLFIGDGTGGSVAGSLYSKKSDGSFVLIGPPASSGSRLMQLYSSGGVTPVAGRGATTSGTSETFLFTVKIPAGSVAAGSTFRMSASTYWTPTTFTQFQVNIRAGTTGTLADSLLCQLSCYGSSGSQPQRTLLEGMAQVVTAGSSGVVVGHASSGSDTDFWRVDAPAEVVRSVDTTGVWYLTFSASVPTGTLSVETATVEAL